MKNWLDAYAHLDSPLHRWEPRYKLVALAALIIACAFVTDVRLIPVMLLVTGILYSISRLPLSFLLSRLRYPGLFILTVVVLLPFIEGQTVIFQIGALGLRQEGLQEALLIVTRFTSILTISLILFGTSPFLETVRAMRRLGLPDILTDMILFFYRYLNDTADNLTAMQTATRLRGFQARSISRRNLGTLAALTGSLLIRSYEQSERVYQAMRLRGYGSTQTEHNPAPSHNQTDRAASVDGNIPVLCVSGLRFGYPERPDVLQHIDLRVVAGERVGLIGCNGSGKTTLFLALCGILTPAAGEIYLSGQPVVPGAFHPAIGMVFQNTNDQLFCPSVRDDVAFGLVNMGLAQPEIDARVDAALATTGTAHLADRVPHHLSGGEKRMVAIAGVLAMQPRLVLYDEPDANLDSRARRRLICFLQESSQTTLISSHDLELILEVCSRVVLLDAGRVVADGTPYEVLHDAPLLATYGLECPASLRQEQV